MIIRPCLLGACFHGGIENEGSSTGGLDKKEAFAMVSAFFLFGSIHIFIRPTD